MDKALIGLAGVVVGALVGATGTYFRLRRDLWAEARASGLFLLAEVCALTARSSDQVRADDTLTVSKTWDSRCEALVRFRPGTYPSGLSATDWLKLAGHFGRLRELSSQTVAAGEEPAWRDEVTKELTGAEKLLCHFKCDPPVLPYVIATGVREGWMAYLGLMMLAVVIVLWVLGDVPWLVAVPVFLLAIGTSVWWVRRTGRIPRPG